jgi:NAD(P)-dependent dehydrogenase (short-subunit alcohol dehydrogenase family)
MKEGEGVALVTGAASGMGRLAAERMAADGRPVAAIDLDGAGLQSLAESSPRIRPIALDVTSTSDLETAAKQVESELGPVERVYAAAGIQPTGHLLNMQPEQIQRVMEVNYGGIVNTALALLPRMLERGRGELVLFGSIASWVPNMHFGAYAASKFAVAAFAEVLYHENRGSGVRICCVCPPPVDTPLHRQATSKPKMLDFGPPRMAPAVVLDAIDKGLARGKLFVFPGWQNAVGWRIRRFAPWLLWRIDHRVEGY